MHILILFSDLEVESILKCKMSPEFFGSNKEFKVRALSMYHIFLTEIV